MRFRHQNSHTYGSKPWELRVVNRRVRVDKCRGYNIYIGDIEIKSVSLQLEIKILNIVIK